MPKTLLLADDSVVIQKLVGLSFANEDVDLVTADNGDDAISLAKARRPDVVIADVIMPGKSGYEVCEAIKQDAALAHIPVLLLTGTFEAFDEEHAQAVGSAGHITKPFEAQALVERVNALLAGAPAPTRAPSPAPPEIATRPAPESAAAGGSDTAASEAFDFFEDDVSDLSSGVSEIEGPDPLAEPFAGADDEAPLTGGDLDAGLLGSDSTVALMPDASHDAAGDDTELDGDLVELEPEAELANEEDAVDGSATVLAEDLFDAPAEDASDWLTPPSTSTSPPTAAAPTAAAMAAELEPLVDDERTAPPAMDATVLADDLFEEEPEAAVLADESPIAAPDAGAAASMWPEPIHAEPVPSSPSMDASASPIGSAFDISAADLGVEAPPAEPSAAAAPEPARAALGPQHGAGGAADAVTAAIRDRLNETLEKVAWEAFSELSEQVVRQVLDRVETVAWEVIPQMTEAMIREEIRRMKGEDEH
jgi:CheY-like chemotaxis protein